MAAYLIQFPSADAMPGRMLVNGVEAMVVFAATSADAIAFAKAQSGNDVDAMWDNADVTAITAASDLVGFTAVVQLFAPDNGGTPSVDESALPVVDISLAVTALNAAALKATGTLTLTPGSIDASDNVKIDTTYYSFAADPTTGTPDGSVGNPYLVALGANDTAALANLVKAINATGTGGVDYAVEITVAHATVEALTSNATVMTVRARTAGVAGNTISTTIPNASELLWGATTLLHGADAATVDAVAAALVVLLNATTEIAAASYNDSSQVLTVAQTTDSLGDHLLSVALYPPGGESISVPGFFTSIDDQGASGDDVSVTLGGDTYVLPKFVAGLRQV